MWLAGHPTAGLFQGIHAACGVCFFELWSLVYHSTSVSGASADGHLALNALRSVGVDQVLDCVPLCHMSSIVQYEGMLTGVLDSLRMQSHRHSVQGINSPQS